MKIVDRATFLALPEGALYSKYQPCVFDDLAIKGASAGRDDWFYQDIVGSIDADHTGDFVDQLDRAEADGASVRMDFETQNRDGLFDAGQLFAVWEPQDVAALIERLQRTQVDASAPHVHR